MPPGGGGHTFATRVSRILIGGCPCIKWHSVHNTSRREKVDIAVSVAGSICSDFSGACDWPWAPTAQPRSSGQQLPCDVTDSFSVS